jgi:hypothetical protein
MTTTRGGRRLSGRGAEPVSIPEKRHRAAVLGDGKVFPIVETLGRRVLREIDPLSSEGRSLLDAGKVTLWFDDGARAEMAPIQVVLDKLQSAVRQRRDVYPEMPRWTAHHDQLLKSIGRMKRTLKPRP